MKTVIDFHAHIFPDNLEKWIQKGPFKSITERLPFDKINGLRRQARSWVKPLAGTLHHAQTHMRYLPQLVRKNLDELSGAMPLAGLLVESTLQDLKEAMHEAEVHSAVVIAHPPFVSNEFVLESCAGDPQLIPVVNIPKGAHKPGQLLKAYVDRGAKVLKIHAAADGEGPDSPRYRILVRAAADLNLPIILHTGCLHSRIFYKNPNQGRPELFTKWFETYSNTPFILAHMNFHDPHTALDLCEEFSNVWVDTSWQPAEIIADAARRIGAERILFGTDWPFVGSNMTVGRQRLRDCVETGMLNEKQAELILGVNALNLLGLRA